MSEAKPYTTEELAVWPVQVSGRDMPVDRARLRATVEALEKAEAQVWCLSGGCMDADCGECRQCLRARADSLMHDHDTIRELLAPLGIGPHDDVVQSVRELMARALPADTAKQVREALASIASRPCYCRTGWSGPCGCSDGMREIAEEVLELLKEDK